MFDNYEVICILNTMHALYTCISRLCEYYDNTYNYYK